MISKILLYSIKNVGHTFPSFLSHTKFSPVEKREFISAFLHATFIKEEEENSEYQVTIYALNADYSSVIFKYLHFLHLSRQFI